MLHGIYKAPCNGLAPGQMVAPGRVQGGREIIIKGTDVGVGYQQASQFNLWLLGRCTKQPMRNDFGVKVEHFLSLGCSECRVLGLERIQAGNRLVVNEQQRLSAQGEATMDGKPGPSLWHQAGETDFHRCTLCRPIITLADWGPGVARVNTDFAL